MASRSVQIVMGQAMLAVGKLTFDSDGKRQFSRFRYDEDWLAHPDRFALSPAMPLSEAPYVYSSSRDNPRTALPHPIADAAPDAWGRGIIAKSRGGEPTELDFLLAADDATRQGALRFLDDQGNPLSRENPPVPRLNDLNDLRELARAYEKDADVARQAADRLIGFAGSLGGARPKSNFDDGGTLSIAKFTSDNDTKPIERVEVATLKLAKLAGIETPQVRLELTQSDRPIAIIARFDRRGGRRIPFISAQTLTGIEARQGGYYTDIADAIRAHGAEPHSQILDLFRRMLFTILVSNNDDHLKNHGFLYAGQGKWKLSPVFDVNPQPERHAHLATGISEISGDAASIEAAIDAAPFFGITTDEALRQLREVAEAVEQNWKQVLLAEGLSERQTKQYAPAFDHDQSKAAKRLLSLKVQAAPAASADDGFEP